MSFVILIFVTLFHLVTSWACFLPSKDIVSAALKTDTIFTGKILEYITFEKPKSSFKAGELPALVQVKTVYKGDPGLESHLVVVQGFGAKHFCSPRRQSRKFRGLRGRQNKAESAAVSFKEGDTRLFLTNGQTPGVYGLEAPLLHVNLKNLRQVAEIGKREKKKERIKKLMELKRRAFVESKGKKKERSCPKVSGCDL